MSTELMLPDRVAVFAALADPARLAIVDHLLGADASPSELRTMLSVPSNLLAHHLNVLERAGVVTRTRSEADGRRTYLKLNPTALESLIPIVDRYARRVIFVCTQNSARSQLAAAIWNRHSPVPATSAGTKPAARVHPGAIDAARRNNVPLRPTKPRHLDDVLQPTDLVIAVCDNAHEELPAELNRLHWSVPDPVRTAQPMAFDEAMADLTERIGRLTPTLQPL
ncbi:helix-turn-helix domain-containing protein [Mycobacterium sp. MBM]|nr:helix-turn-helix domain-containing protein [Mycobacterium sp. MBM]